jgi:hypothetical protein
LQLGDVPLHKSTLRAARAVGMVRHANDGGSDAMLVHYGSQCLSLCREARWPYAHPLAVQQPAERRGMLGPMVALAVVVVGRRQFALDEPVWARADRTRRARGEASETRAEIDGHEPAVCEDRQPS